MFNVKSTGSDNHARHCLARLVREWTVGAAHSSEGRPCPHCTKAGEVAFKCSRPDYFETGNRFYSHNRDTNERGNAGRG